MSALALPSKDRSRLVALLGMLGSDYDGERANAAKMVSAFVRDRNLGWDEIIVQPGREVERPKYSPPPPSEPTWVARLRFCHERPWLLSQWEQEFVGDVLARGRTPTEKQMQVINRIYERMRVQP